jgi:hypothetical protein
MSGATSAALPDYAQANLETKRKPLERLENSSEPSKPPLWKHDKSVLAWLDTL